MIWETGEPSEFGRYLCVVRCNSEKHDDRYQVSQDPVFPCEGLQLLYWKQYTRDKAPGWHRSAHYKGMKCGQYIERWSRLPELPQ